MELQMSEERAKLKSMLAFKHTKMIPGESYREEETNNININPSGEGFLMLVTCCNTLTNNTRLKPLTWGPSGAV